MTSSRLHVRNTVATSSEENLPPRNAPVPRKPRRKADPEAKMHQEFDRFMLKGVIPYAMSLGLESCEFLQPFMEQYSVMVRRSHEEVEGERAFQRIFMGRAD